ncbi:MAG: hypothetical protein HOB73_12945 [Planctomycetaceae bacterium]|jgi:hypothetical protein|nr:hypothetical protein [Planctomycetaceae bacterium]
MKTVVLLLRIAAVHCVLVLVANVSLFAQTDFDSSSLPSGFYKDLFMSSGVNLSSRKSLPAAESLGLSYEYYAGKDAETQNRLMTGDQHDTNGVLLYPDGAPRFRMIYVNGGSATNHGKSLELSGRQTLRQFFNAGGSYCGSCAGSFLSGRNVDLSNNRRLGYLHIYPYNTLNTGLKKEQLDHVIPDDSPLLKYRQFGTENRVEGVYHNNGNWMSLEKGEHLENTEILAVYDAPGKRPDQGAAIWAYKVKPETGRVVNIGSHPEGVTTGDRLSLTEACFLYSLDGTGTATIKGKLVAGETREMLANTTDKTPAFAKIGDGQIHYFSFQVESCVTTTVIDLNTEVDVQLNLYLSQDLPKIVTSVRTYRATGEGNKTMRVRLAPGTWYVAVECANRVQAVKNDSESYYVYDDPQGLLNGVAYSVGLQQRLRRRYLRVVGSVDSVK